MEVKFIYVGILIIFSTSCVNAQILVKNINMGMNGSSISMMSAGHAGVVFVADDGYSNRKLYFTSGAGDLEVLYAPGPETPNLGIYSAKTVGDTAFFFTYYEGEVQLWMSDLQSLSSKKVFTFPSGCGFSGSHGKFTRIGDRIYFTYPNITSIIQAR